MPDSVIRPLIMEDAVTRLDFVHRQKANLTIPRYRKHNRLDKHKRDMLRYIIYQVISACRTDAYAQSAAAAGYGEAVVFGADASVSDSFGALTVVA